MTAKVTVKGIKGKTQLAHAVYDFSVDGGAVGVLDLFSIPANNIVHDFWAEIEEAPTSGGSATLEVGITGGDTDGYLAQVAYTALTLDLVTGDVNKGALLFDTTEDSNLRHKVTASSMVALKIGTAALLTGKIHFYVEYSDGY
jgi:hypothetical protein